MEKLDDKAKIKDLSNIQDDDIILDIGPKTISLINSILENSKSVLWNGPAGYFENTNFAIGSEEIGKIVSLGIRFTLAGGDTLQL